MADQTLTVQDVSVASSGLTPAYTTVNTSDNYFAQNNGRIFLHVKNATGGAATLTVESTATVGGLAVADLTATIPATTGDKMIGPFPQGIYNDSQGRIKATCNVAVTIAAVRV